MLDGLNHELFIQSSRSYGDGRLEVFKSIKFCFYTFVTKPGIEGLLSIDELARRRATLNKFNLKATELKPPFSRFIAKVLSYVSRKVDIFFAYFF